MPTGVQYYPSGVAQNALGGQGEQGLLGRRRRLAQRSAHSSLLRSCCASAPGMALMRGTLRPLAVAKHQHTSILFSFCPPLSLPAERHSQCGTQQPRLLLDLLLP